MQSNVGEKIHLLSVIFAISFTTASCQHKSTSTSSTALATRSASSIARTERDPTVVQRKYSSWSRWSPCSRLCEQKRFRSCLLTLEDQCPHGTLQVKSRQCSPDKCSDTNTAPRAHRHVEDILQTNSILEEFFYSAWSKWSPCYVADCKQYRTKVCTLYPMCGDRILVQQKHCHVGVCDFGEHEAGNGISSSTPASRDDSYDGELVSGGQRSDSRSCGISSIAAGQRIGLKIFGGRASSPGRWPWQVSLLNMHLENYCAGTLISNWVVTAAHCIRRRMYIRLGEHNVHRVEDSEQLFRPVKIVSHPDFNIRTIENDIAMIKISSSIRWGPYAHPACLPDAADDDSELLSNTTKCVILGWGKRKPQARYGADVLHEADVDIISHTRCKEAYYQDHAITPRMLCAGNGRSGRTGDTCEGDSGGPLLCQLGSDAGPARPWKLFGVTSFGDSCGKRDKYGVYTKVAMYLQWINGVIARD